MNFYLEEILVDIFDLDCPYGSKCCVQYSCEYCSMVTEYGCGGCETKMNFLANQENDDNVSNSIFEFKDYLF